MSRERIFRSGCEERTMATKILKSLRCKKRSKGGESEVLVTYIIYAQESVPEMGWTTGPLQGTISTS